MNIDACKALYIKGINLFWCEVWEDMVRLLGTIAEQNGKIWCEVQVHFTFLTYRVG